MTERGLGRLPEFDPRSRAYPVRALVGDRARRSYTWRCPIVLDQGAEGACVGFAWAHEAAARPDQVYGLTDGHAVVVYRRAQQLDQWPGESYEGTSVIAGAKVAQEYLWLREYRWAFSENDLALAVGYAGPAVLGIDWHASMMEPSGGWVVPDGNVIGGHAILCVGYNRRLSAYRLHNSWGPGWGGGAGLPPGEAWIREADMAALLASGGEACVPVTRRHRRDR